MRKFFILIFGFPILLGCGSGGNDPDSILFSETAGGGDIHLTVSGSENPSFSKQLRIVGYRIFLEGEGFETVEQTATPDAAGVMIRGIPSRFKLGIRVQALNAAGEPVREGNAEGITIEGGETRDVAVVLQTVPTVLNIADNHPASNHRLYFQIFTDPGHAVVVSEEGPLTDVLTSLAQIPADEKGLARFYPGILPPGTHHFTIQDVTTGRSSRRTLHLWDGGKIKGAPFVAAGKEGTKAGFLWTEKF